MDKKKLAKQLAVIAFVIALFAGMDAVTVPIKSGGKSGLRIWSWGLRIQRYSKSGTMN